MMLENNQLFIFLLTLKCFAPYIHSYLLQLLKAFRDVQSDVDQRPVCLILTNSMMQIEIRTRSGNKNEFSILETSDGEPEMYCQRQRRSKCMHVEACMHFFPVRSYFLDWFFFFFFKSHLTLIS